MVWVTQRAIYSTNFSRIDFYSCVVISVRHRTSFHRPILRTIIRFLRMIFILVQEYCFETTSFHGCILRAISRKEDEGKEDKSMQSMGSSMCTGLVQMKHLGEQRTFLSSRLCSSPQL
ncbi:uncharacterized protein [Miscanthus floridulus]|uniref:uncharacterized protein isoform X3 n=1 Tax=Miscanthus floridulus TaxID=154761 RepID=UPI00345A40CE